MNKTSNGYDVVFTFKDVGLNRLNELHRLASALLTNEEFEVRLIDPVKGIHDLANNTGINPAGIQCPKCTLIDCRECEAYKRS